MKPVAVLVLILGLSACQTADMADRMEPAAPMSETVARGLALAQSKCTGCHEIRKNLASPNPDAPPFVAIANMRGLTDETLSSWLRDAHNYPEAMNFQIASTQVDDLTAYFLTLKDETYQPGAY